MISPQPAITVSGVHDKGGRGIAAMINDYLAFSTDIDLVERTLAGKPGTGVIKWEVVDVLVLPSPQGGQFIVSGDR